MLRRIAAGAAAWALVVACSTGSGPPSATVSAAQACADNAHQRCTQLQTCSATDLELRYGSESTCESRETNDCTQSLTETLNGNTPAALEACAAAYPSWACADYLDGVNIPTACKQQLGSVVNGGACAIDGQCASGFCGVVPGAACGTCAALPKIGASCAELTGCGPGHTCTADTFVCVAFGVRGSACGKGAVCGVGLSCVGATAIAQGTCQQAGEDVGAACDPTGRTRPGCDRNAGFVCNAGVPATIDAGGALDGGEDASEGGAESDAEAGQDAAADLARTCQTVVVAAAGQPCGDDVDGQPVYCQAEGACTGASGSTPGICTAAAADGAPCDTVKGPGCVIPARCIGTGGTAGTCQYSGAQICR